MGIKLEDLKVSELKARCKKRGIKGYSDLRKSQLINCLRKKRKSGHCKSRRGRPRRKSSRRKKSCKHGRKKSCKHGPKTGSRKRRSSSRRKLKYSANGDIWKSPNHTNHYFVEEGTIGGSKVGRAFGGSGAKSNAIDYANGNTPKKKGNIVTYSQDWIWDIQNRI